MKALTVQSQSGAMINLRCEKQHGNNFQYTAEIPKASITLRREKPWYWDAEQGQKILVLGFRKSQRQATTVSATEETRINEFIAECREWQETEKQKIYQPLIDQLPEHTFQTTGDDEKAQVLLEKAAEIKDVRGPEMDGVNRQQHMRRQAFRNEARKHCSHNLEESYQYTFTGDARRKIVREITCEKCDMFVRDKASEDVPEEAMWR